MSAESIPSSTTPLPWWTRYVYNTAAFVAGFIMGGISGYFGNWLWYRFGPHRKKPHFNISWDEGSASVEGVITPENKEEVYESVRVLCRPSKDKRDITETSGTSDISTPNETRTKPST